MKKLFRKLYLRWFRPFKSLDVQLVSYEDANALMKLDKRWELHTEREDGNTAIGWVWIEKREYITE